MKKLGYIRTSTEDQVADRQVIQLEEYCDQVFIEDGVSAVGKKRPVYELLLEALQDGDTLVVTSLDRAFRSSIDALLELDQLHQRGVYLQSLTMNIDTRTPDGRFIYTLIAALAEWERMTLSLRTKEGLEAARRRGKVLGRPRKLNETDIIEAKGLLEANPSQTISNVAAKFSVSPKTLSRAMAGVEM